MDDVWTLDFWINNWGILLGVGMAVLASFLEDGLIRDKYRGMSRDEAWARQRAELQAGIAAERAEEARRMSAPMKGFVAGNVIGLASHEIFKTKKR